MPNIDKLLKQGDADFKRYTGIHTATFYDMQEYEASKTKSDRPSALSLKEQILLALTYGRGYRTLYHISMDFGIYESSARRIIRKIENVLVDSGKFELRKKLPSRIDYDINHGTLLIYLV